MNSKKNLAAQVAGAIAIAALVGTSAFAESRHSDATERDHGRQSSSDRGSRDSNRSAERHDRSSNQSQTFQRNDTRSNGSWNRNETRNNSTFERSQTRSAESWNRSNNNRSFDRSQTESFRNNNRSFDRSRTFHDSRPSFDSRGRRSDFVQGRVSRFVHERGGYRIWVDGGRFPVWIPEARIGLFPHLRVGLSLRFGGYYDPLGYLEAYDYYNDGYYGGGYGGSAYSSGLLRGVVETVDYRRGTLVLRDDVSGSFVTTLIRDRRLETLRPGDYVEIAGDWTRAGVFEGLRLEDTRDGRY
ncbi:MAG: hypothetical protein WB973_05410 [Thermoanaerobaculia bacterium]